MSNNGKEHPFKKIQTARLSFLTVVLFLLHSGCLSPIELDIPNGLDDSIVINAKIVKGEPSVFTLELSQLFNFTVNSRATVVAKKVMLRDNLDNELEIKRKGDGVYYHEFHDSDPFTIEIGSTYSMSLEMLDGRIFESSPEILLSVPQIDSMSYKFYNKVFTLPDERITSLPSLQYTISTQLSQPDSGEKSQLRWELTKVYKVTDSPTEAAIEPKVCYVTDNAGVFDILIYDGIGITLPELENYVLHEEPLDETNGEGQYFTIYQESLSPSAYRYWEKVKEITARKDNIYSEPVGKIESNFTHINGKEEVFGFFYVTEQDTARIYLDPELLGFPDWRCPPNNFYIEDVPCNGTDICCDCLSVDNSVIEKPEYWID